MKELNREILLKKIETLKEGKAFIDELHTKNKLFYFDDDPIDIGCFTPFEAHHVDCRVTELFKIEDWEEFEDPFGYALHIFNK